MQYRVKAATNGINTRELTMMLTLRKEQLDQMEVLMREQRLMGLATYVRRLISDTVANWSDTQLCSEIQSRLVDASFCGFTTDYNIVTYLAAAFLMGEEWLLNDPVTHDILLDRTGDETLRADRLDARLVDVAGDRITPWEIT